MPTYISFFGLINIQEAGEETKLKTMDLWCHLSEITDGAVWCDSHLFVNPENFGIKNGHLCILDYGNSETHDMLKKFSDKIYNEFDFLYSWDEEKQQAYTNKG